MEKEIEIPTIENLEKVLMGEGSTLFERWEWRIKGSLTHHHPTQPAIQYKSGEWFWYWMDKRHRLDGPAAKWDGRYAYWIHGEELTKEEWSRNPLRIKWLREQSEKI